jgi:coproporphyrinogen III oxidase-like Fe-S oxidoreductase
MLWFEPLFLKILQREYAASMHFDAPGQVQQPQPTEHPCQLYVHIPFCEVLCPFCSFHRVQYREDKSLTYFEALRREIRSYHERGFRFGDVYVGGGTPTIALDELVRTLELIRSLWPIRTVSVETNPNHLDERTFGALQSVGVGRLSVGVQSFDDGLLRQMGRYEKYGSGAVICRHLRQAAGRFRTLNVDMIFNLPDQTLELLDNDLRTLLELQVDQVSFYPLMTAPTARLKMEKSLGHADPTRRHEFYQRIVSTMQTDYRASSAWCFGRRTTPGKGDQPSMIDEYIIEQNDYVGVGSGSFSYVNGWMYSTTFSLNQYRRRLAHERSAITRSKRLSLRERMRYDYLVRLFGLSLSRGSMKRKYGRSFWIRLAPELVSMRLLGATRYDRAADSIVLTDKGMYCWVLMMAEFFNAVNSFRDAMRQHIRAELDAEVPKMSASLADIEGTGRARAG